MICAYALRARAWKNSPWVAQMPQQRLITLSYIFHQMLLIAMSIHTSAIKNRFKGAVCFVGTERKSHVTIIAKSGFFESHHNYGKCRFWTSDVFRL
jgi:hypothetical protein